MPDTRTEAGSFMANRRIARRSGGLLKTDSCLASISLCSWRCYATWPQTDKDSVAELGLGCKRKYRRGTAAVNAVRYAGEGLLRHPDACRFPNKTSASPTCCSKSGTCKLWTAPADWRVQSLADWKRCGISGGISAHHTRGNLWSLKALSPGSNLTAYPSDV